LAKSLFRIEGIERLFFGSDFISVTKKSAMSWDVIKPLVLGGIMEYFLAHDTVEIKTDGTEPSAASDGDSALVQEIRELIDQRVRPAVAQDGGDILFKKFDDGVVYVQLKGACSGCPSSTATLKSGIENMLRHYVPEVQSVEAI
jgi:Fe-S cluster biogenesis protein NfuA